MTQKIYGAIMGLGGCGYGIAFVELLQSEPVPKFTIGLALAFTSFTLLVNGIRNLVESSGEND